MNSSQVVLRLIKAEDLEHLVALFKETVHHVNAKDYTQAQLSALAPDTIRHSHNIWKTLPGAPWGRPYLNLEFDAHTCQDMKLNTP